MTINLAEFNELYLPFQWIKDTEDPGVLDKDELWVDPRFLAVNAYLKEKGEEELDTYEIAKGVFDSLKSGAKGTEHPLLTRDIASRKRIKFTFDLNGLPGSERNFAAELVRTASLADLYYKFQKDPEYVAHLKQVLESGDAVRIQHFWQNSGSKCISIKAKYCTSLPDVNIDPNGIWWPDEFSEEDVQKLNETYEWSSEALKRKALTPLSCIVEAHEEEPDAFFYNGKWYKVVSQNSFEQIKVVAELMAGHLGKAALIVAEKDPGYSELLADTAAHIKLGSIYGDRELDRRWVDVNNDRFITSFASIEDSTGAFGDNFGVKSAMQGVVAYIDPQMAGFIEGVSKFRLESDERLWRLWEENGETVPIRKVPTPEPSAFAADVIMNSGDMNSALYVAAGFIQPNYDNYDVNVPEDEQKFKIVDFGPIMAERVRNQGMALAKISMDEKDQKEIEASVEGVLPVLVFTQAHEMNHKRAMFNVAYSNKLQRDVKFVEEFGRKLGAAMDEAKSDLLGLFEFKFYEEKGLIDSPLKGAAYRAFIGSMLRDLYLGSGEEHGNATVIVFHLLTEHDVMIFNEKKRKYSVNYAALEKKLPHIVKEFMDTFLSFDKNAVEALDSRAQNSLRASPMWKFIDEAKKAEIPEENVPYYMVLGLNEPPVTEQTR